MPTVEKVRGGETLVRGIGRFVVGETAEVSHQDAEYLLNERDDFRLVKDGELEDEDPEEVDGVDEQEPPEAEDPEIDEPPAPLEGDPEVFIERGECPWCSEYEGDAVPQHASAAHPDEWAAYTEG